MLRKITLTSQYKNWYRMFCSQNQTELTIEFNPGVNVLVAPNGTGKTTFLGAIENLVLDTEQTEGVIAEVNPSKSDRKNVFFFSVKDMQPKQMLDDINPMKQVGIDEIAHWINRTALSHGQATHELMEDIAEVATNGTAGLIIIDEPELALDAENIFKLIESIKKLESKTQFIIVSHHPWLVLNRDFNVINLNPDINTQTLALDKIKKLNLME